MSGWPKRVPTFKCAVFGHEGCGKTAFIQRHLTGAFEQEYLPTHGIVVIKLLFNTSRGPICFEMWERGGAEYNPLPNSFFKKIKCAILMFDVGINEPFANFDTHYSLLNMVPAHVLRTICVNKTDIKPSKKNRLRLTIFRSTKISVKTNLNIEKPFEYFARRLFKDRSLELIPRPEMLPAQVRLRGQDMLRQRESGAWAEQSETDEDH
ncbi:GTP-binding nuclear protein Ran-like [Drosophila obscura]|uniref:GTP-binding nuclear protein Ran-like n=1 Tax=Drosophila obscura TaxID=7282 RepID=UPI000BA0D606|nr:GTP-binding nuclear protein Ran-like [Drosophila obscura]XP_022215059.1 GTP-binding nuclear protein Ran-like [Drosophila obscura]